MAYTTINKSADHFKTLVYTGNGSDANSITGVGFKSDWVWTKNRDHAADHYIHDSVRGVQNAIRTNNNSGTYATSINLQSFDNDGFTLGTQDGLNKSGDSIVSWNWLAGGASPSQTYTVKVVSDSGNKYRFDDFGTSAVTLDLQEGGTYTFDQSDSSNAGHPLRFSTTSNGTHGGGSEYTTGVTTSGTPGSSGAYTRITVASGAATLYYYCTQHSGMGGQANTNSTHGSSNFSGSTQSTVTANTTSGFSIVKWSGTGSTTTVGHGLGATPACFITKSTGSGGWGFYHQSVGNTKALILNETGAGTTHAAYYNNTSPTSSVFTVNSDSSVNHSGNDMISYCFTEKTGFSKFGDYTGNGNADGTFVYTGFKPAFVLSKNSSATQGWFLVDHKRPLSSFNPIDGSLHPNASAVEDTSSDFFVDFYSNGFKVRDTDAQLNASGNIYVYMAFAEAPLVGSNNIAANAR